MAILGIYVKFQVGNLLKSICVTLIKSFFWGCSLRLFIFSSDTWSHISRHQCKSTRAVKDGEFGWHPIVLAEFWGTLDFEPPGNLFGFLLLVCRPRLLSLGFQKSIQPWKIQGLKFIIEICWVYLLINGTGIRQPFFFNCLAHLSKYLNYFQVPFTTYRHTIVV